jgi:hypothetical protein
MKLFSEETLLNNLNHFLSSKTAAALEPSKIQKNLRKIVV